MTYPALTFSGFAHRHPPQAVQCFIKSNSSFALTRSVSTVRHSCCDSPAGWRTVSRQSPTRCFSHDAWRLEAFQLRRDVLSSPDNSNCPASDNMARSCSGPHSQQQNAAPINRSRQGTYFGTDTANALAFKHERPAGGTIYINSNHLASA